MKKKLTTDRNRAMSLVKSLIAEAQNGESDAIQALRSIALSSIAGLHDSLWEGHGESVEALHFVARESAERIGRVTYWLTERPESIPGLPAKMQQAIGGAQELAQKSSVWPVALNVILEVRLKQLEGFKRLSVGKDRHFKVEGKRKRDTSFHTQTGFALHVFNLMESFRDNPQLAACLDGGRLAIWPEKIAKLPKLARSTASIWADEGILFWRDYLKGDFELGPFPKCARAKVGKDPSGDGSIRTAESALREKIYEGLLKVCP